MQQPDIHQIMHFYATMLPVIVLFWFVKIALYVIPMWRIAKRAGLSGPIALLAAIPLVGRLITLYILAFSDWQVTPNAEWPYAAAPYGYPPTAAPVGMPPQPTMYTQPIATERPPDSTEHEL